MLSCCFPRRKLGQYLNIDCGEAGGFFFWFFQLAKNFCPGLSEKWKFWKGVLGTKNSTFFMVLSDDTSTLTVGRGGSIIIKKWRLSNKIYLNNRTKNKEVLVCVCVHIVSYSPWQNICWPEDAGNFSAAQMKSMLWIIFPLSYTIIIHQFVCINFLSFSVDCLLWNIRSVKYKRDLIGYELGRIIASEYENKYRAEQLAS